MEPGSDVAPIRHGLRRECWHDSSWDRHGALPRRRRTHGSGGRGSPSSRPGQTVGREAGWSMYGPQSSADPSMRTLGGEVARGRCGRSRIGGSLSESFTAGRVAVLEWCTASLLRSFGRCAAPSIRSRITTSCGVRYPRSHCGIILTRPWWAATSSPASLVALRSLRAIRGASPAHIDVTGAKPH